MRVSNPQLTRELLDALLGSSPGFFEQVVVELLVKMGYGGSRKEAGQVVGRTGDGGIDGIIEEDRLALEAVYVQTKRWENPVSRPEIPEVCRCAAGTASTQGHLHHNLALHRGRRGLRQPHREPGCADRRRGAGTIDD